jgi:hypothetical protein
VRRAHRSSADGAGLDIGGTADLLTVITGHRVGLTERFVAYRAINGVRGAKPVVTNETLREMFLADPTSTV